MWKTAITTKQQYSQSNKKNQKQLALTLLEEVNRTYSAEDEELLEALYATLATQAHVFKITKRNRFHEMMERFRVEVINRFTDTERIRIHDLGSSNAITALELYDSLQIFRPVQVHASDYFNKLQMVSIPGTKWTVVYNGEGKAIQFVRPPFVISAFGQEGRRYPFNRLISAYARTLILPRANKFRNIDVALFHPTCVARAEVDKHFTLGHYDAFTPMAGTYHIIRAMNFLNHCYFPEDKLAIAIKHCGTALLQGGLFVAGRSIDEVDGRLSATVFERKGNQLYPLWDCREGSEIRKIVEQVRL